MRLDPGQFDIHEIRKRFDRVADTFDDADFVHRSTFDGLLERLQPVAVDAKLIVDLGSATGNGSASLAKTFRKARVLAVDASGFMLDRSKDRHAFLSKVREVQADACRLPLRDHTVDLVVANMLLPWITDLDLCFSEINRVLRKDGVFAFASLGPDSLSAFSSDVGTGPFPDMHDVGDGLVRAGLREPVLDVDRLRVTWGSSAALVKDMLACGATGDEAGFPATDIGHDETGRLAIDLELVFGHAWGSGPRPEPGEFRVEAGTIGRRGRDRP
jgi:malonyl-CoA O-methyltransferase